MARTPSNMLPLGTALPEVLLPDGAGDSYPLRDSVKNNGLLVMFICNHCPFVLHIADYLPTLARELSALEIGTVAISSNDAVQHPEDGPDKMVAFAAHHNFPFPYLYDEAQTVAQAFDAACTPDFFLFDGNLNLAYRGQIDAARPGNDTPVNGVDVLAAARALAAQEKVSDRQVPSLGCGIKWKL
ncbi:thioredoxin family protein [Gilvimarinus agarilyticus]|uniref:thioredoxin family protein n=1 Tax=unclassified Gilvimarinus TaxID=2642066 RepID=UPI001C09AA9F|nr:MULTISPECIES: thioredoxin family protein [unclassified Gilvimarinus]MBU2887625.1 thioredoxin family protein [Gilvimarinus agarilyticus]MDO6572276.1 thioredoxin family protein [Gilvimarinus sp. 2_MG-2023]MDO6746843.1 thioredoxin family protein [Gilvimarinus sp. 1_MG-2023]